MFLLWCPKTIQSSSGRFSILLSFQKKLFFGGILLVSESPYLRVVNFTTILDVFFICNGKFILDIFNKNQITIKIVCTIRNVTKSIPPKKCFFWNDKKLKIGRGWPKSAGRFLNCFGTSQQKHLKPFHDKIMLRSSILKKISPTKRGVVISSTRCCWNWSQSDNKEYIPLSHIALEKERTLLMLCFLQSWFSLNYRYFCTSKIWLHFLPNSELWLAGVVSMLHPRTISIFSGERGRKLWSEVYLAQTVRE